MTSVGAVISHKNRGSSKVGLALSCSPCKSLFDAGNIWAAFLCAGSGCTNASVILNLTPLSAYPAKTPCFEACPKAVIIESLI